MWVGTTWAAEGGLGGVRVPKRIAGFRSATGGPITTHKVWSTEEKQIIQRLLSEIRKAEGGVAAYGEADVHRALEARAIDILLVSEGLRKRRVTFECGSCHQSFTRVLPDADVGSVLAGACPSCRQCQLSESSNEDYVEGLFGRTTAFGGTVRLISSESEEGEMLNKAFGGIAAILRYPLPRGPSARGAGRPLGRSPARRYQILSSGSSAGGSVRRGDPVSGGEGGAGAWVGG